MSQQSGNQQSSNQQGGNQQGGNQQGGGVLEPHSSSLQMLCFMPAFAADTLHKA